MYNLYYNNYNYYNMDAVLNQFRNTVITPENEPRTNYESLYKNLGRLSNQEQRRQNTLDVQRRNRSMNLDSSRGILDLVNSAEEDDRKNQGAYRPSAYVAGFTNNTLSMSYKNVLMMSEWMVEKPEDFNTNWYVVPCPKGTRTLVVSSRGNTKFYNKQGYVRTSCETALPGGNRTDTFHKKQCVILDCFHVESISKLFVLDVLAWNSQPMTDCETEFRYFWLKSHFDQIPELNTINKKNKILFEILPKVECDPLTFNHFMMTIPHFKNFVPPLDGLLFYHKLAHYESGVTPLVGWLYPYMVNEILGSEITVNPTYLLERPLNYINQAVFIRDFAFKAEKKLHHVSMDVSSSQSIERPPQAQQCSYLHRNINQNNNNETDMEIGNQASAIRPRAIRGQRH